VAMFWELNENKLSQLIQFPLNQSESGRAKLQGNKDATLARMQQRITRLSLVEFACQRGRSTSLSYRFVWNYIWKVENSISPCRFMLPPCFLHPASQSRHSKNNKQRGQLWWIPWAKCNSQEVEQPLASDWPQRKKVCLLVNTSI